MGEIHPVQGVTAASLNGLPDARISRREESQRQGQADPEAERQSQDDVLELHEEASVAPAASEADVPPAGIPTGLDLTA
jgi:hypothetical protein